MTTVTVVTATTADDWRAWLAEHGQSVKEVWLVIANKHSGTPSVRYHEAIEHALCFGWIDSQARKLDPDSVQLRFTPRRPTSRWSQVNRRRAEHMIELGLMTGPGQAEIDRVRASGTWLAAADPLVRTAP
jgi:uncharacterized protein YdeI (YjbR/CyaY-like superfamily)